MSNPEQVPQRDYDFWDYVACARCHLSFTPEDDGPPPVPFWVTECGHIICNNHLQPDQSCAKCSQRDIQVAPLQRDMDPPMCNWFSSAPQALDTLAFATRFQMESLASLVRYYKRKCAQQRSLIERMKPAIQENKDLRRALEGLQPNTYQTQGYMEPSDVPNDHGKRQMLQMHSHDNGVHANSSPLPATTSVGPGRLTLPRSHQQPNYTSRTHHSDDGLRPLAQRTQAIQVDTATAEAGGRPGSRRFAEQYAYSAPPARQGMHLPPQNLAYSQTDPVRQAHGRRQPPPNAQTEAHIPIISTSDQRSSALFRPSQQQSTSQPLRQSSRNEVSQMPPPPTPLGLPGAGRQGEHLEQRGGFVPQPPTPRGTIVRQAPQRLLSASSVADSRDAAGADFSKFRAATPMLQTQRFLPPTPSGRQRFADPSPSLAGSSIAGSGMMRSGSTASVSGGGQRQPFVPGG